MSNSVGGSQLLPRRWGGAVRPPRRPARPATAAAADNPHATLQVSPGASAATIKASYYRIMKQLHPDLNPNTDTTAAAVNLNAAYAALMAGQFLLKF